ncbi:bifunctional isocitrate dehydrogenase kinase/phosphatase [Neisseria leonii]|uniref:Isocitrate dehydrogenase kinase/phosphatase n=1 Tax=Neisseria leonii TaxID=2995413 RepID=A0A9X4E2W8_9NEIS|nr:bifunctional isocitrate dehydrogenase kinase/phosphatase [Neisseria sp. 51.81]MDD9328671.1 bifunctional isocitrate dehydrogenase kinase/phosphatase [Neisseria sp. 51.81]
MSPPCPRTIAETILAGFNRHYRLYREASSQAKHLFEARNWKGIQDLVAYRIQMYDNRVREAVDVLRETLADCCGSDALWAGAKKEYIALLVNHKQPELAETFFNSVSTKVLAKEYFNNQFIFVKPAISTEFIDSDPPAFRTFYPAQSSLADCFRQILHHFGWQVPFAHEDEDIAHILAAAERHLRQEWPLQEMNLHIKVLHSPFYRNKSAYIFGQIVNGSSKHPFALPVLHNDDGRLVIDAALFDPKQISVLFSFARAYFLVDMPVPSSYVRFLREMLPMRSDGDFYTLLGLHKQGKGIFWREFTQHLQYSDDKFIPAPGIKGLVMSVFTLPSFPYVFKVIKDVFGHNKDFDRDYVRGKYLLVKKHDRVGRMADTLEFSNVPLPKHRCDETFLQEMRTLAPNQIEETDDWVIIKHVYIEHRLKPLNLFMQQASPEEKAAAVIDYGFALKELASANIFPGDMLYKNFGMTRFGRVIFYDYDEIEYMTDCNFRKIPPAPSPEMEMSDEIWYPVRPGDVFPEEFGPFLLGEPDVRQVFMKHHKDLLTIEFWQGKKTRLQAGLYDDFYPYPQSVRFRPQKTAEGLVDDTDV